MDVIEAIVKRYHGGIQKITTKRLLSETQFGTARAHASAWSLVVSQYRSRTHSSYISNEILVMA